jgi:SPX domain protein involved in polyphosphate accumulation
MNIADCSEFVEFLLNENLGKQYEFLSKRLEELQERLKLIEHNQNCLKLHRKDLCIYAC